MKKLTLAVAIFVVIGWLLLCFGRVGGRTPLMEASNLGLPRAVRFLLFLGAHPNATDTSVKWKGRTALSYAAQHGNAETVRVLLEHGADPNLADSSNYTPLCLAMGPATGSLPTMALLLDSGAETSWGPYTAFGCLPAQPSGGSEQYSFLIQRGALSRLGNPASEALFVWAAGFGQDGLVEAMLHNGMDANVRCSKCSDASFIYPGSTLPNQQVLAGLQGRTALMDAAARGRLSTVQKLIASGADKSLRDPAGLSALDLAKQNLSADNTYLDQNYETIIGILKPPQNKDRASGQ